MDVKGRVLYLSYDGLTDPLGQSQVLPYLQKLSERGYRFTVLSFEKKERFAKEASLIRSITQAANIEWVPLSFSANPPLLSKMYDRYRMWKTALRLQKKNNYDLVHCRSYVAAEAGLKLKKKFGTGFLFDMRGFWANEKVDNGQWDLDKWFYRKLYRHYKGKEKEFLLGADEIVSLTQAAKDYLLKNPEYKDLSIEVIPCCADLQHFDFRRVPAEDVQDLKRSLGIPGEAKVITYLGSIGGWYMIKEMFAFFKLITERYHDYYMLLLTKDHPQKVKHDIEAAGIPQDKVIITYSDRNRLPLFLAMTTYSIFFIRNTFSKTASSPTKHAELMGMGIPVICNDIGDTGNIINQTHTGIVVNEFDEKTLRKTVDFMAITEPPSKEHIRSCALSFFDLEAGTEKYFALYNNILAKKNRNIRKQKDDKKNIIRNSLPTG
jgi:glycosyltransferase involved in cell wall biosynthesis